MYVLKNSVVSGRGQIREGRLSSLSRDKTFSWAILARHEKGFLLQFSLLELSQAERPLVSC